MSHTYIIQYAVYNDRKGVVAKGKIKVKGDSDAHAMNRLRVHLNDLYWDLHRLEMTLVEEVVPKEEKDWEGVFGPKFGDVFKDLFGK